MRIFTKINGKIAVWQVEDMTIEEAILAIQNELGAHHKSPVLALVKY